MKSVLELVDSITTRVGNRKALQSESTTCVKGEHSSAGDWYF